MLPVMVQVAVPPIKGTKPTCCGGLVFAMEPQMGVLDVPPTVKYTIPVGKAGSLLLCKVAVIVIVTGDPSGAGFGLAVTVNRGDLCGSTVGSTMATVNPVPAATSRTKPPEESAGMTSGVRCDVRVPSPS
jgi:hypothetical protein